MAGPICKGQEKKGKKNWRKIIYENIIKWRKTKYTKYAQQIG